MNEKIHYLITCLLLALIIFLLVLSTKSGNQCLSNPLVYGVQEVKKGGLNLSCSCSLGNEGGQGFILDDSGARPLVFQRDVNEETNFSDVFKSLITP